MTGSREFLAQSPVGKRREHYDSLVDGEKIAYVVSVEEVGDTLACSRLYTRRDPVALTLGVRYQSETSHSEPLGALATTTIGHR